MSTTQNQGLSVNKLHPLTRDKICKKLDIKQILGGDFKTFAGMVGMSVDDIALISQSTQPTEDVLKWWEKRKEATVTNLRKILQEMGREDVVIILEKNPVEGVEMSTDGVDGHGNHVDEATAITNGGVERARAGRNNLPSPPPIDLIKYSDMKPKKIDWPEATKTRIDVLLIAVNDNEFRAAYGILRNPEVSDSGEKLGNVYFSQIERNKVALLRSSPGAGGKTGMQVTCLDGIKGLNPKAIISLGVCFGMDERKHKLGDVLVSKELGTYSSRRVNNDGSENNRGVKPECDARLTRLFSNGMMGWESPGQDQVQPTVYSGLVISGPELIDNANRKESLKSLYPEALGGEMEGEGLYNICEHFEVPWIVCKAISDWADGSKDKKWQPFAAKVSASLVKHVLEQNYIPRVKPGKSRPNESGAMSVRDEEDGSLPSHRKRRRSEDDNEAGKSKKAKQLKTLKIDALNGGIYQRLCMELNKPNVGKDYIALGGEMGYSKGEIADFKLTSDPTNALLDNWKCKSGNNVPRLIEHLRKIGQENLVELLMS